MFTHVPEMAEYSNTLHNQQPFTHFYALGEQTLHAVPYDYGNDVTQYLESLSDEDTAECLNDVRLPFEYCWVRIPLPEIPGGILLHDDGSKKIGASVCIYCEDAPLLETPAYLNPAMQQKFIALGNVSRFIIYPLGTYEKDGRHVDFPQQAFTYGETSKGYPLLATDEAHAAFLAETAGLTNAYNFMVTTAVMLASAITKKSLFQPLMVDPVSSPDPLRDKLRLRKGNLPSRTPAYVRVDLTKARHASTPNPNSPATKLMRARHWVGGFSYFKPSLGRTVDVGEHERWKDSSPVPAQRKPHKVRATPMTPS